MAWMEKDRQTDRQTDQGLEKERKGLAHSLTHNNYRRELDWLSQQQLGRQEGIDS